jgi:MFS family permease
MPSLGIKLNDAPIVCASRKRYAPARMSRTDRAAVRLESDLPVAAPRAMRLRDIAPWQWKSATAAWLGWLFDGLDMHLYVLVAAPFVAELLHAVSETDPAVSRTSGWIQAAFLVGWAMGGGVFGRVGDLLGRSRALSLTILTYAVFTGLSFVAQTWWQLMIFRFAAALGIGGEWAVGASLLAETWPSHWRPWLAAVLQTGVNLGVLIACLAAYLLAGFPPRCVFLVGIVPALLVFWIRRSVPEPEVWEHARTAPAPGIGQLFAGSIRRTTILTTLVCAASLTAWWAFLFWSPQHIAHLPDVAQWTEEQRKRLVSSYIFLIIGISIGGNFFGGWLAKLFGYRRAVAAMFLGFFIAMAGTYIIPRDHISLLLWTPWISFFSGVFGLFTMYLPPLFPTLLRTTGAGCSFNIGRLAAAAGTVVFGSLGHVGNFRIALLCAAFLFLPAFFLALFLPDLRDGSRAIPFAAMTPAVGENSGRQFH